MAKQRIFSNLVNVVKGIMVEILATLILMCAVFVAGFLILVWVSK